MNNATVAEQLLLGVALACVFLASAVPKLRHPRGFILAVLEYRVLPERLAWLYGRLLPPLELGLALLLLSGTAVRLAAIILSMLLLSFLVAVSINLARGRTIDCHCFGRARRRPIGWPLLLQDGALLGASIVLAALAGAWISQEPWSVFRLLGLRQAAGPVALLVCAALTACTVLLAGPLSTGKSRAARAGAGGAKRGGGKGFANWRGNFGGRHSWDRAPSRLNGGSQ
jgi:hypothetical protein